MSEPRKSDKKEKEIWEKFNPYDFHPNADVETSYVDTEVSKNLRDMVIHSCDGENALAKECFDKMNKALDRVGEILEREGHDTGTN